MIDEKCRFILQKLGDAGHSAYLVGGCVRDSLMERPVHDHDIASSALPQQVTEIFSSETVIPTGIKHGTVTLLLEGTPYEITTFRIDGDYSDSRRPDSVEFTRNIRDDLARRDFTMNAMAMDINGNIFDPFGGKEDIRSGIIRCVGDPVKRFTEDALRILRGIRFASQTGFTIEKNTSDAILSLKERLSNVSYERIRDELDKLICGRFSTEVMLRYPELICQIIPELSESIGFEQHSRYHKYNVYEHTIRAVGALPEDELLLRRTMLLHDVAKPACFTMDENGTGHFKHHGEVGAEMAEKIYKRLRYDNKSVEKMCRLIYFHSRNLHNDTEAKLLASEIGPELFSELMECKKADNMAKNEFVTAENADFDRYSKMISELIKENACLTLRQLDVNGRDLNNIGIKGRDTGNVLNELLKLAVSGEIPNQHNILLEHAKEFLT